MNPYTFLALVAAFSTGFMAKQIELHHSDRYVVTVSKLTFQLAENRCDVNGGVIDIKKRPMLVDRFTFACENGAEFNDTWADFRPVTKDKKDHFAIPDTVRLTLQDVR